MQSVHKPRDPLQDNRPLCADLDAMRRPQSLSKRYRRDCELRDAIKCNFYRLVVNSRVAIAPDARRPNRRFAREQTCASTSLKSAMAPSIARTARTRSDAPAAAPDGPTFIIARSCAATADCMRRDTRARASTSSAKAYATSAAPIWPSRAATTRVFIVAA